MIVRLIFYVLGLWIVMALVRAVLEALSIVPRGPGDPSAGRGAGRGHQYRSSSRSGGGLGPQRVRSRREALAVLGLSDGADDAEIRSAYKKLAQKYHPDRVVHLGPELVELTSEKFKQVKSAYELLVGDGRARAR